MITLGISTAAGQFVLLLGNNNTVIFNSTEFVDTQELDFLLSEGLKKCGKTVSDICEIIVDIGPGGTSSVRTGVAFANALSYSLDIPVCPVTSNELACFDIFLQYKIPVIFTVKSIKNNAYIGFYNGTNLSLQYGKIEEIVPKLVENISEFVVVGAHRELIINLLGLKSKRIVNSEKIFGNAELFIRQRELFSNSGLKFPRFAEAVTENLTRNLSTLMPPFK
jgi:tRNA A37 threonylcarbamoyladenosine modification protein TsaB